MQRHKVWRYGWLMFWNTTTDPLKMQAIIEISFYCATKMRTNSVVLQTQDQSFSEDTSSTHCYKDHETDLFSLKSKRNRYMRYWVSCIGDWVDLWLELLFLNCIRVWRWCIIFQKISYLNFIDHRLITKIQFFGSRFCYRLQVRNINLNGDPLQKAFSIIRPVSENKFFTAFGPWRARPHFYIYSTTLSHIHSTYLIYPILCFRGESQIHFPAI